MHIRELKPFYVGGFGKVPSHDTNIYNPRVTTLHLMSGEKSKVLIVDVDAPQSSHAYAVRKHLRRDDFIVYSSEFTINDVFEGRCRFKVFYLWDGSRLPRKKNNHNVEIFYADKSVGAFAGNRGDGHEYKISTLSKGVLKPLHFDVNDVVEVKIKEFDFFNPKKAAKKKRKKQVAKSTTDTTDTAEEAEGDILGYDKVNIIEFQKLLMEVPGIVKEIPKQIIKKGDILTFDCLFPETHSDLKGANAYAFKKDGVYVVRCHGNVCADRYWKLNKELKEIAYNKVYFDNSEGFPEFKEKHVLFQAPTGWGKTEKIAEEALKAINEKEKVLILLQSKEAIMRMSDRINDKSGGAFETLYQMGKIYIYTSEHKDKNHALNVEKANVILSHHYYFINAGNILTYYRDSMEILNQPNIKVIIDEAHTYVELVSRLDLEVGGLYKKDDFAGFELWTSNVKSLTEAQAESYSPNDLKSFTRCLEATLTEYGSVELKKQWKLYPQVKYLDIVDEIETNPIFEVTEEFDEDELSYKIYKNKKVEPIKENSIENEQDGLKLLTNSAERIIITRSIGDEHPRKHIGRITFTAFHTQILKMLLDSPMQVLFTTATWENYHDDIITHHTTLHKHIEEGTIEKIGKVILLRAGERKTSKIRRKVLETTNDLNARALMFFPTIAKAREIAKEYENIMLNDNGMYSIGKRKSSMDYIDNFVRNVTVAGLESSVAKGYNYLEEVDGNSEGFELIYFDRKPVSPTVIKKYFDQDGKIRDYQSDYKWSAFAQAIGRAFRKAKDALCIAMNDISDDDYRIIKNYIATETRAEIIEDTLTIMNVKISIPSFINSVGLEDLTPQLKDNQLFRKIYLNGKEKENENEKEN